MSKDSLQGILAPGYPSMNSDEKPLLPEQTYRPPPRDKFLLAYFILFLHGIGHLAPWNFFITATSVNNKRLLAATRTHALHAHLSYYPPTCKYFTNCSFPPPPPPPPPSSISMRSSDAHSTALCLVTILKTRMRITFQWGLTYLSS